MKTKNKIELLNNYLKNQQAENFIGYDYDPNVLTYYFKFTDIIYSEQFIYISSLNIRFDTICISNNIYLSIRNF